MPKKEKNSIVLFLLLLDCHVTATYTNNMLISWD